MKNRRNYNTTQLCLFSVEVMAEMTEVRRPVKVRTDTTFADWLLWELGLLPALNGQGYRDQFAFLSGRVKPLKPREPVVESDAIRSYDAIIDRVRPTLFLY